MIVVSSAYALSVAARENGWKPVIGWQNLVTVGTVSAESEEANFPASNLANPATNQRWESASTADQYLTVAFAAPAEVDYFGIERHNLGSEAIPVTVEGLETEGGEWITLWSQHLPANDRILMGRFEPVLLVALRVKLEPDAVPPSAAVLYVGKLIVLEHGIPPGHIPINYSRKVEKASAISVGGDSLGTVTLTSRLEGGFEQRDLDPDWYREILEPFRAAYDDAYFFFAWAPQDYPDEVGFCWVTNDPAPRINKTTGHIDISFQIAAVDH